LTFEVLFIVERIKFRLAAGSRNYSRARKCSPMNNKLVKYFGEEKPEFYSFYNYLKCVFLQEWRMYVEKIKKMNFKFAQTKIKNKKQPRLILLKVGQST
jgi:hypothetical protein